MDEPLSNLDAKLRVQTCAQIAALQQRLGVTTVYVTHDQVEAMTMGDRVAVLLDGILQQVDGSRALYDKPANAFVAGFIGSAMNIRTVRLTENGADFGGLLCRSPVSRWRLPAPMAAATVTVGFRPEHTELVGASEGGIPVVVELVEELGSDAYPRARPAQWRALEGDAGRAHRRPGHPADGRDRVLRPRVGAQHVFHASTGVRL